MQKRFFCLRGYMKSGTNWLGQLLNSHEQIQCLGEFHWQHLFSTYVQHNSALPTYGGDSYREKLRHRFEELIRQSMLDAADDDTLVIGDRTPQPIEPITLRDAPHISIVRDGRDVLVSRIFHLYNNPEVTVQFDNYAEMRKNLKAFQSDPWYFKKHPSRLLMQEPLIRISAQNWKRQVLNDASVTERYADLNVRIVKYEDLHRDVELERKTLFEFLDVDPTRAAKIKKRLKPSFKTERPNEFLRKGVVGDWKNYFTDEVKQWFKEEAGDALIQFDYESSLDW